MDGPPPTPPGSPKESDIRELLAAVGRVGQDLLAVDWAATPLGPPERWPQALQTSVRIMLGSRFAMWMAWGDELTFFCNDAYRRDTLGTKYPWALGRPASEVWAEIWPDIGPRIATVLRTGQATWDEALLLFLERSGYREETYHTFSYSPLSDDDGRVVGMLCVVSEETERVIGERRMATLRDLGAALTTADGEQAVLDATCDRLEADRRDLPFSLVYLYEDETASRAHLACAAGVQPGSAVAPTLLEVDDPDAVWPAAPLAGGATLAQVDDLAARFGPLPTGAWDEPPQQALLLPLSQQGQPAPFGFLAVAVNPLRRLDEDVTAFATLLAAQVAAGIASARAYDAERRRAQELAELDRAKTAFFTNVSHELRTPLTLLLGPAENALADRATPLPDAHRERVELVLRNAQRLLKLVNTLLDFSRLQSGSATAAFEPVDLGRVTAELASMFESAAERGGVDLVIACAPLPEPVYVDREMWAKIVLNLVSNALKFTFDGSITVRVDEHDGHARLSVTDTGIGIEPGDQERLFERFHRVVGARSRSHEGSGIGLALVAELAELHGGRATVESAPGEGSTFSVLLPFGAAHLPSGELAEAGGRDVRPDEQAQGFLAEALRWVDDDGAADHPVTVRPDEAGDRRHAPTAAPRVLVVDDNADMREYVASLLAGDYAVETAADGEQALELARRQPPDLVLSDVMMPRLDGFGLLRALQDDPATMHVPVVLLSARAGEEGTIEGLEAGADDYLTKPFSARELLARVRANLELERVRRTRDQLQRSRRLLDQAQRLAKVGSWELDLATGAVSASEELLRQLQVDAEGLEARGFEEARARMLDDGEADRMRRALEAAVEGQPLDHEMRVRTPEGDVRTYRTLGQVERDEHDRPVRLWGTSQDVTEQRAAEAALASAAAEREAATREHRIADELQRSLLPVQQATPDHLEAAAFYRAGVEGTQVGGDWYDVIELGAGRTALVIGDVMGRGVHAAAVMGQLRAAVRAYSRLDLPPADLLEYLDGVVRDLDEDQIVTCVYAVYDSADGTLAYANAGHLPPLMCEPGGAGRRLTGGGPPLGTGPWTLSEERVELPPGTSVALYTDGLVERRDRDLDTGIDEVLHRLGAAEDLDVRLDELPAALVDALTPDDLDDDVAVLVARVAADDDAAPPVTFALDARPSAVREGRAAVSATLTGWHVAGDVVADAVLVASELVTNAVLHGAAPIELRVRRSSSHVMLEVRDGATVPPQKMRPDADEEHGRGLQLVASLSDRWGTRPLDGGKAVWCTLALP
ncbi:SpoIIE family protein phosphatase [Conexibacter sp. SYSU D00693]|uniref:SpoIIE family protein phosphatase n=1 Tax=Conexibacter sp. SYSU D00693 TaxID=2812560 RepID=UPI00196AC5FD|nr:SpoIIE family protein phosphatase [Conexibacter sp. SYSU D00693]